MVTSHMPCKVRFNQSSLWPNHDSIVSSRFGLLLASSYYHASSNRVFFSPISIASKSVLDVNDFDGVEGSARFILVDDASALSIYFNVFCCSC